MQKLFLISFLFCFQFLSAQKFNLKIEKEFFFYKYVENQITITTHPKDSLGPMSLATNMPTLKPAGENGRFIFIPMHDERTVRLIVMAKDSQKKNHSEDFDVILRNIPPVRVTTNGKTELKLSKEEITEIELIGNIPDFIYPVSFVVDGFVLNLPGKEPVRINGNKIPEKYSKSLKKLKSGQFVIINDIDIEAVEGYYGEDKNFKAGNPVVIEVK